ncbi:MAG: methylaspartate mutase [Planctomycetota bacterium]|nr:MAG: methylaspartate mutase [Planctomycetota bacterium]
MTEPSKQPVRSILATDCGSTTTKAILIERTDEGFRLKVRGEAPTTVEKPFDDVTVGVINAVTEVQELIGRPILDEQGQILIGQKGDAGVDLYLSTSSAGGGLQMLVAGVVRSMTAESAERAALGAGAIVMDVICSNDKRQPHEQISRIRQLRPDMVLLSGGVDGGTTSHVAELAELIGAADPKPRLGSGYELPVVFAGNVEARGAVTDALQQKTALSIVDNLRPELDSENLGPARDAIHDLFMEHVMAQAPGYDKLKSWTSAPVMPTPGAVGAIIQTVAEQRGISVIGVDIGGATTDVFSVFGGTFNRTVSANLGMSYSISNVMASAGIDNVMRWVPFDIDEAELRNRIKNKMVRPTTIPSMLKDLQVEQALAREALRLSLVQHKDFATELKGVRKSRDISEAFNQSGSGNTIVDMMELKLLVGSGGVLSHAPRRVQAALMLIDSFEPMGVTRLAVDSIFMMPQLGVLASIHEQAATEVFERDCLVMLGTCVAPVGKTKGGRPLAKLRIELPDGAIERSISAGDLQRIPLPNGVTARCRIEPAKGVDVGAGKGQPLDTELEGGEAGILLDGRGRPLAIPGDASARVAAIEQWIENLDLYPRDGR